MANKLLDVIEQVQMNDRMIVKADRGRTPHEMVEIYESHFLKARLS